MIRRLGCLALTLVLAGCGTSTTPPTTTTSTSSTTLPQRPAGTPDYYVIGISGKCITDELKRACWNVMPSSLHALTTTNNYNYLVSRGTLPDIAEAIAQKGWKTAYRGYAASLFDRTNTSAGTSETHPGFVTLTNDIANIYNRDIKGVSNPAKIVIVAHSHGVVWAHLLSVLYPAIPIEIQVDFDGVCLYWQSDNQGDFETANLGNLIDFEQVCRSRDAILGGAQSDLQNVTGNNVRYNLDIHSSDPMLLDLVNNQRPDGSTPGIYSAGFNETHSGVTQRGGRGLNWAVGSVSNLTPSK